MTLLLVILVASASPFSWSLPWRRRCLARGLDVAVFSLSFSVPAFRSQRFVRQDRFLRTARSVVVGLVLRFNFP